MPPPSILDDQRALAQPKALFGPLLDGDFERGAGEYEIIGIDQDMADFAVRTHSFDAEGVIFKGHRLPCLPQRCARKSINNLFRGMTLTRTLG
jgi:hypothetical protein